MNWKEAVIDTITKYPWRYSPKAVASVSCSRSSIKNQEVSVNHYFIEYLCNCLKSEHRLVHTRAQIFSSHGNHFLVANGRCDTESSFVSVHLYLLIMLRSPYLLLYLISSQQAASFHVIIGQGKYEVFQFILQRR